MYKKVDGRSPNERKQFSLDNVIRILKQVKTDHNVSQGETISIRDFKKSIVAVTQHVHPYYLNDFIGSMEQIDILSVDIINKEITIIMGPADLE